jgi:hypothetical protein
VAAVVAEAEFGQRAKRIVVGAVVTRPERDRLRRAGGHQRVFGELQQPALVFEREVLEIASRAVAQWIGCSGEREPFGVQVQLNVMTARGDWLDDIGDGFDAP